MQLLYVANRHEKRPEIARRSTTAWRSCATATSRRASPTARRRASTPRGSRRSSASCRRRTLLLLDIAPETAAARKADRPRHYERDLALLSRVRESYHRQAAAPTRWVLLDGERPRDAVQADVVTAIASRLAPP